MGIVLPRNIISNITQKGIFLIRKMPRYYFFVILTSPNGGNCANCGNCAKSERNGKNVHIVNTYYLSQLPPDRNRAVCLRL